MDRKSAKFPGFKSEAEEAEWYATPQGRAQTQREFEKALRAGKVVRLTHAQIKRSDAALLVDLMEQAKAKATKAISLRLPIADIELAKKIAATEGIGYQVVLKQAIRKGLKRAV